MTDDRHRKAKTIRTATGYLRDRPWLAGLCGLTVVSLLLGPVLWQELASREIVGSFSYTDFGVYYRTTGDWLAGETIYDVDDPFGNFLYPPLFLLAVRPFYELQSWPFVAEVWVAASVIGLWKSLQLLIWTYQPSLTRAERTILSVLTLGLLLSFHPIWYGMRLGQASIAIAAVITLAVVAMERQSDSVHRGPISGGLTAIGGSIKTFYAPVGAHLLTDWRRLVGAIGTGVLLLMTSMVIFGIEPHFDYLEVLAWGEDWGGDPAHPSWGWIAGYYRPLYFLGKSMVVLPVLAIEVPLSLIIRLTVISAIVALAVWLHGSGADREVFAVGILAIPLVGPQVSVHDLAVLLPAIVIVAAIEYRQDGHLWVPILGVLLLHWQSYGTLAFASVPGWVPLSSWIVHYSPLLQPALYANIMLLGLTSYRALEYRPPRWLQHLRESN